MATMNDPIVFSVIQYVHVQTRCDATDEGYHPWPNNSIRGFTVAIIQSHYLAILMILTSCLYFFLPFSIFHCHY